LLVQHTLTSPTHTSGTDLRPLLIDLEPDIATSIPSRRRLASRHLREIELQGSRVRDAALGGEADGVSGVNFVSLSARPGGELVAADGVGTYVGYGAIGLVVCCLADVLPCAGLIDVSAW
jgi:hypothetical protein